MEAPARAVAAGNGTLLGALEFRGGARLVRLEPGTLQYAAPPLRLRDEFVGDFALSPDGRRMAIGSEMHSSIQLVDLRGWRFLGTIPLPGPRPGGYGGIRAYDTAGERRFSRFEGADAIVRGAAGRHAYVEAGRPGRRRIHVIELDSGRTVRTLAWRELRVLGP